MFFEVVLFFDEVSDCVVGVGWVINVGFSLLWISFFFYGFNYSLSFVIFGGSLGYGIVVVMVMVWMFRYVYIVVVVVDGINGGF